MSADSIHRSEDASGAPLWTSRQKVIVALAAIAIIFDGLDNQILGYATPSLIAEWQVTKAEMAPVSAAGLVGMAFGAILAGAMGDRFGRRTMLLVSMFVFGMMTMLAGFADNMVGLGAARFAAGLGLGGALPNATAYAAEFSPMRQRPLAITLTIVCVPLGGLIAGILARYLLPISLGAYPGWRILFMIAGAGPVLASLLLLRFLPESPLFNPPENGTKVRDLLTPELRRDTISLWIAMFACLMAVYTINAWTPTMLKEAGYTGITATDGLSAFNLGGIAGGCVTAFSIMRYGSRRALLLVSALAMIATFAAGVSIASKISPVLIVAALTAIGFAVHGVTTSMFALTSHAYPDTIRSTGVGAAVGIGRTGAILSAFVGSAALSLGGGVAFFGLVFIAMLSVLVALFLISNHIQAPSSNGNG